jgi:hypothetical protein
MRLLAISLVLCSTIAAAANDPGNKAKWTVVEYVRKIDSMKDFMGRYDARMTATACKDDVEAARKAGVTKLASDEFKKLGGTQNNSVYEITIDRAAQLCAEYAMYEMVGKHFKKFEYTRSHLQVLTPQMAPGPGYVKTALENVDECRKAVDEIIAAGVPTTLEVKFASDAMTVADLKPKICDTVADAAAKFTKDMKGLDDQKTERFTKVGIKGDKLDLVKKSWGFLFLAGGTSSDDAKKYAAASLIFEWTTSDPDGAGFVTHTVRRYQFSGNKLAKTTEKTYRKRKGDKVGDVFH